MVAAADSVNEKSNDTPSSLPSFLLTEDSVVLITGAAGFLGSQLALALHRTFAVRKIIAVDSMDSHGFGSVNNNATSASSAKMPLSKADLALFEFKRQRVFHVLQQQQQQDQPETAAAQILFYRVDFRPSIPEYFDSAEVPVLHHIFEEHADITHVVHLADHTQQHHHHTQNPPPNQQSHSSTGSRHDTDHHKSKQDAAASSSQRMLNQLPRSMVIPRLHGQEKAGMIESIFEELILQHSKTNRHISFVYASSADVYSHFVANHQHPTTPPPPFSESDPLTTPSTVAGATKLVDEVVAQAYAEAYGIPSMALRYFTIYGPWDVPGSPLFGMSERAVTGQDILSDIMKSENSIKGELSLDDIVDYIYIDDAIDATMAAMQFTPPRDWTTKTMAVNVGTGNGTSLRTISKLFRSLTNDAVSESKSSPLPTEKLATTASFANLDRANRLLGFVPRVSLSQGLSTLLAWQADRAFPYGSSSNTMDSAAAITQPKGLLAQCDRYDAECLHGTPVFPCASECASSTAPSIDPQQQQQCRGSLYDDILDLTRALTSTCSTVLYTVDLNANATHIPSTRVRVSTKSVAYVVVPNGNKNSNTNDDDDSSDHGVHCNLAFVSDVSPLYLNAGRKASTRRRSQSDLTSDDGILKHGFWSLIPVSITEYTLHKVPLLSLLPKLSPGKFFANSVQHAIFCDPDITFDSIPRLIQEATSQPKHPTIPGATLMMIGKKEVDVANQQRPLQATPIPLPQRQVIQEDAYRMIRMAVIDEMVGDGFAQELDVGFIVHTLRNGMDDDDDDGRMFRCDVWGEVLQWQVDTDVLAWEFILGLHDMWSRVMVHQSGLSPWWIGDDVSTVSSTKSTRNGRRLQEHLGVNRLNSERQKGDDENGGDDAKGGDDDLAELQAREDKKRAKDKLEKEEDDEDEIEELDVPGEHNGFGAIEAVSENNQHKAAQNQQQQQQRFGDRPQGEEDNDFVVDDDDAAEHNPLRRRGAHDATDDTPNYFLPRSTDRDLSSYDVWMGILSSTSLRYFCRIVAMDAVGAYRIVEGYEVEVFAE